MIEKNINYCIIFKIFIYILKNDYWVRFVLVGEYEKFNNDNYY